MLSKENISFTYQRKKKKKSLYGEQTTTIVIIAERFMNDGLAIHKMLN